MDFELTFHPHKTEHDVWCIVCTPKCSHFTGNPIVGYIHEPLSPNPLITVKTLGVNATRAILDELDRVRKEQYGL